MTKEIRTTSRWWDLPAAALLLAAMVTSAARLVATGWTGNLRMVQTVVVFAVVAGLAVGLSRFPRRTAFIFSSLYGAFVIPWQLGTKLISQDIEWTERLLILSNRLGEIIIQLFTGEPVYDSLLFLILMLILFWIMGAYAGYMLVRHGNAWKAVIPGGLALFIIHSFDPLLAMRALYLAVFLFFFMILVARMTYLHRHNRWQKNRTTLPPHIGVDFIRFALYAAILIILFAWTAPALADALPAAQNAWQPVNQIWRDTKENFKTAFASLRSTVNLVKRYYGDTVLLGHGTPLSDIEMFKVIPPDNLPNSIRMYWRARSYDTYDNGRWSSLNSSLYAYNPNTDELNFPAYDGRWAGTFEFISSSNIDTLYLPSQPLWVNRPGQVEYAVNADTTIDISVFRAIPNIEAGNIYQAQSSLSHATATQLKSAGVDYPEWVAERYLGLPVSLTPRTLKLAEQITAGWDTPYAKTIAVTNYLRKNIEYVDQLPETPPANQDIVDWFLFDLQQGFCNYYSTAEVILLRSVGIPARWSIGYAQGERTITPGEGLEEGISYIVRLNDAHAWPEVYFPGIGWVEFEPTVSQPDIDREPGEEDSAYPELRFDDEDELRRLRELDEELALLRDQRNLPEDTEPGQNRSSVVYSIAVFVTGSGLLILAWFFIPKVNLLLIPIFLERSIIKTGIKPPKAIHLWARRAELPPLTRAYLEVNRALTRLGRVSPVDETPAERANKLGQILPPARKPAHRLVQEYQVATFSTRPANLDIAQQAGSEVRKLSIKAYSYRLISRLLQRFRRFQR